MTIMNILSQSPTRAASIEDIFGGIPGRKP